MNKDPVAIDELRHDIDNARRLAEQDRLEAEFKRDPDWDMVAEYLVRRETIGSILECFHNGGASHMETARIVLSLSVDECAREYAEREAGK